MNSVYIELTWIRFKVSLLLLLLPLEDPDGLPFFTAGVYLSWNILKLLNTPSKFTKFSLTDTFEVGIWAKWIYDETFVFWKIVDSI